jgi:hypothetical protein
VNAIQEAAAEVQRFCDAKGWRGCFIGGVAVQRWGEPRLTQDVDLTILTGFGSEAPYVDALLDRFAARRQDARDFALRYRVVLIQTGAGTPIDVSLGALPYEERVIERASPFVFGADVPIITCGPEDLVILKAFAGREQDWLDIQGVATRQGDRLDKALIVREAAALLELKEAAGDLDLLRTMLGA